MKTFTTIIAVAIFCLSFSFSANAECGKKGDGALKSMYCDSVEEILTEAVTHSSRVYFKEGKFWASALSYRERLPDSVPEKTIKKLIKTAITYQDDVKITGYVRREKKIEHITFTSYGVSKNFGNNNCVHGYIQLSDIDTGINSISIAKDQYQNSFCLVDDRVIILSRP